MKKKLIYLLCIFLLLGAAGGSVVKFMGTDQDEKEELLIVTSFYPIYLLTVNLTQGAEGVAVKNLTENINGCIHDYQLTTEDMRLLSEADIFIQNGGGMESFMDQAAGGRPDLLTITACDGIELTGGEETAHSHSEEGNAHVWTDPALYLKQIANVEEALSEADPARASVYASNALSYQAQVEEVSRLMEELSEDASEVPVILFHDAFVYLANAADMKIVHSLDLDADTSVSAGEMAEMIEEAQKYGVRIIFTEDGIPNPAAERLAAETGAAVYGLNPLVSGGQADAGNELSAYITGMMENIAIMKEAAADAGR